MNSPESSIERWQSNGTILAVEDDVLTRTLIRRTLERHGFEVLEARDGHEALAVFRLRAPDIRAVLLDLSLPRLRGEDAVRELKRIQPAVPIIVISGHSRQTVTSLVGGTEIAAFVPKPFGMEALLSALRECLE